MHRRRRERADDEAQRRGLVESIEPAHAFLHQGNVHLIFARRQVCRVYCHGALECVTRVERTLEVGASTIELNDSAGLIKVVAESDGERADRRPRVWRGVDDRDVYGRAASRHYMRGVGDNEARHEVGGQIDAGPGGHLQRGRIDTAEDGEATEGVEYVLEYESTAHHLRQERVEITSAVVNRNELRCAPLDDLAERESAIRGT